jgi:type IV pilus assembly protein PilO
MQGTLLEKVEKIKMRYRVLILIGIVVLFGGLFVGLVALPKYSEISRTQKEIGVLNDKLNQAKIRAKKVAEFEAELSQVDMEFQEALKLLPNEREIPSLLRNITQLGSDSQLEFRLFNPERESPKDFYFEIPVGIEVSGGYHDVAVFFDKVGRMERIVNINDVSMKPVTENSTTLITRCTAVTYRFKGTSDADNQEPTTKK